MFDTLSQLPLHQRRHEQRHPLPGVITIIRRPTMDRGDHYLLIKRNADPYAGMWAMIGGKWEFGETLAAAITREVREETGLNTTFIALRGIVNERMVFASAAGKAGHYILFVCEVFAPDGLAQEQFEGKVAWFTLEQIEDLNTAHQIIPNDYAMMQQFAWASAQPYVESEMVCADAAHIQDTRLLRFQIVE